MSETNKNNKLPLNESDLSQVSGGIGFEFLADQAKGKAALAGESKVRAALLASPNAADTAAAAAAAAAASESDRSL